MMNHSEKDIRELLNQDIRISDVVEARIQETYKQLGAGKTSRRKPFRNMAAAIAVVCLAIPGVVYASSKTDFFQAMFGNTARESNDVIHREIDTGKGTTAEVTLPSREYVPVDDEKAETVLGQYVMDTPFEKKIGNHTLCIESFLYDKNGALMYFTLEKEGGVTALAGDQETNQTKGAYFTDDADFYFTCRTKSGSFGAENTYIDMKKSTDDKLYCYSYILWSEALKESDTPQLFIETYPCARKDIPENAKIKIETEKINLTDKEPVPMKTIDLGNEGYVEYSPISLSVDMSKGMGLSKEEAADPYYMEYMAITYKDENTYIICDTEKNIENSSYQLGSGTWYKTVFNRMVDVDEIEKIQVNGVEFTPAVCGKTRN